MLMGVAGRSIPGQGWSVDRVRELARCTGAWLSARTASQQTWQTYAADVGIPFLLSSLGADGITISREVHEQYGVALSVRKPGPRNTTWHLSFLPWLNRRGIDPWSSQVCEVMPLWGREMVNLGRVPDHVWSTDAQRTAPLSSAFIRRRAASVRAYYAWHYAMGLTECSPADIWTPKAAGVPAQPMLRHAPEELDRDDLARLQIAADEHQGADGDGPLTSAVIAVLIATACRGVEISRMTVHDYRRSPRSGPQVRLWTKGGGERWVRLDEATMRRVDQWLMWRPDLTGSTVDVRLRQAKTAPHAVPLFVTLTGRRGVLTRVKREQEGHAGRLGERSIYNLLRRVCSRARDPLVRELRTWIYPHSVRAAVATDLLDQGVPLHEVQRMLGHSSPTTTARYDRQAGHRHVAAATVASGRQAYAIENAQRRALTIA